MPRPKLDTSLTASRKQLVAVTLLFVALIALLAYPTGESKSAPSTTQSSQQSTPIAKATVGTDSATNSSLTNQPSDRRPASSGGHIQESKVTKSPEWTIPLIDIQELKEFNPFQDKLLAETDTPDKGGKASPGRQLAKFGSAGTNPSNGSGQTEAGQGDSAHWDVDQQIASIGKIAAIITGSRRPAVMIEDQVFYEQDVLQQRWRILAIKPTGIVVQDLTVGSQQTEIN